LGHCWAFHTAGEQHHGDGEEGKSAMGHCHSKLLR
jgi:hypothetical protein